MSDPKYNKYKGTVRFDDDNIVDIDLQPDTENITVLLNGEEVAGGSNLPEVDSGDNGKVLTVVSGEWAAATPATPPAELPAVTATDNGDVLTVVEGSWAKAAPAGGENEIVYIPVEAAWDEDEDSYIGTSTYTIAQLLSLAAAGKMLVVKMTWEQDPLDPGDNITFYMPLCSVNTTTSTVIFTLTQFENGSFSLAFCKFATGVSDTIITLDFVTPSIAS